MRHPIPQAGWQQDASEFLEQLFLDSALLASDERRFVLFSGSIPSSVVFPILAGVAVLSTAFGHHHASCSLRCLGRRGCALESPAGPGVSRTGTKSFDKRVLAGYGSGLSPRPGSRTPVFTVRN